MIFYFKSIKDLLITVSGLCSENSFVLLYLWRARSRLLFSTGCPLNVKFVFLPSRARLFLILSIAIVAFLSRFFFRFHLLTADLHCFGLTKS